MGIIGDILEFKNSMMGKKKKNYLPTPTYHMSKAAPPWTRTTAEDCIARDPARPTKYRETYDDEAVRLALLQRRD